MKKIKVIISSSIDSNLYALLVSHLCIKESDISIVGVITLKTVSFKRIKAEYKRIGHFLFVKVIKKFFTASPNIKFSNVNINNMISEFGIKSQSLKSMSNNYSIPYIKVDDLNNLQTLNFLNNYKPDLILSMGSTIIRKPFLDIPALGVLNVHMGILPYYRGMGVTEWPIIENKINDIGLGITLHYMDSGVDTGPIIKKQKIDINGYKSIDDLDSKYLIEMINLMVKGVKITRDKKLFLEFQKSNEIDNGRQYYSTHKRMRDFAEKKLITFT